MTRFSTTAIFLSNMLLMMATTILCEECKDGHYYPAGEGCFSSYYVCSHGDLISRPCPAGTVYNPDTLKCDHSYNVDVCLQGDISGCTDPNGNPLSGVKFTKSADCDAGVYYKCVDGEAQKETCPSGTIYDPKSGICKWAYDIPDCGSDSVDGGNPSTPTAVSTVFTTKTTTKQTTPVETPASTPGAGSSTTTKMPSGSEQPSDGPTATTADATRSTTTKKTPGPLTEDPNSSTTKKETPGPLTDDPISSPTTKGTPGPSTDGPVSSPTTKGTPGPSTDGPVSSSTTKGTPGPSTDGPVSSQTTKGTPGPSTDDPVSSPTTKGTQGPSTDGPASSQTTKGTPGPSTDDPISSLTTKETSAPTSELTSTTPTTTTPTTTTSTTTEKAPGKTYVGFVVDDTGSMSKEIEGVKQWIIDCVAGKNCGNDPTGGWIITSFNDPGVGRVVGPTLDVSEIISEVSTYRAHGGGDCPELAFAGLRNAVNVVPDRDASNCKIYFFTDATAKDYTYASPATEEYVYKNCALIAILTGCCGTCPDACDSVDPEYCIDHVGDHRGDSSRAARIAGARSNKGRMLAADYSTTDIQTLFYTMSEQTGGNVYITDKPSSSDEMLDFLTEEVTLGFCDGTEIAGPLPHGYKCEKDCQTMKMCWDKSVNKCYCNDTLDYCPHDEMKPGYSRCDGSQVVECDDNVVEKIVPDIEDCRSYFQCNGGNLYHFTCANGTLFSTNSTSHCDHPEYAVGSCVP